MAYSLKYGSVIQLPTENPYGLITHELKKFHEEDFTISIGIRSSAEEIEKNKKTEENPESCVFGRAGMHMGLFYVPSINSYKWAYWDSEDGETYNYKDIHSVSLDEDRFVDFEITHSKKEKTFKLYMDGEFIGENTYENLLDYSNTFIFIGVANLLENAFPHQCFWAGDIEYFSIYKKCFENVNDMDDSELIVSYDFEEDNTTYYSLFDISDNGNRGRINQDKINKQYNLV